MSEPTTDPTGALPDTRRAVADCRRGLVVTGAANLLLATVFVGSFAWGREGAYRLLPLAVGAVWLYLLARGVGAARAANDAADLIQLGELRRAEDALARAVGAFTLARAPTQLAMHRLALLRQAQGRFDEAALAARAFLGSLARRAFRPAGSAGSVGREDALAVSGRLLLADALLRVNDVAGAAGALAELRREVTRGLTLDEQLDVMQLELEAQCRSSAWTSAAAGLGAKAALSELLGSAAFARVNLMLALAAERAGDAAAGAFLRRRAELVGGDYLTDADGLAAERPWLARLTPSPSGRGPG